MSAKKGRRWEQLNQWRAAHRDQAKQDADENTRPADIHIPSAHVSAGKKTEVDRSFDEEHPQGIGSFHVLRQRYKLIDINTVPLSAHAADDEVGNTEEGDSDVPRASRSSASSGSSLKNVLRKAKLHSVRVSETAREAEAESLRRVSEVEGLKEQLSKKEKEIEDLKRKEKEHTNELIRARNEAAAERHRRTRVAIEHKASCNDSKAASRAVSTLTSERDRLQAKLKDANQKLSDALVQGSTKEKESMQRLNELSAEVQESKKLVLEKEREAKDLEHKIQCKRSAILRT